MSDRIAVMSRGRVEQIGTPEEIYGQPGQRVRGRLHRLGEPAARARWPTRPTVQLDAGGRVDRAVDGRRQRRRPGHGDDPPRAPATPTNTADRGSQRRRHDQRRHLRGLVDPADRPPRRPHRDDGHGRRRRRPAAARAGRADHAQLGGRRAVRAAGPLGDRRRHHHRRRRGAGRARRQGRRPRPAAGERRRPEQVRPPGAARRRRRSPARRPWSAGVLQGHRRRRRRERRRRGRRAARVGGGTLGTGADRGAHPQLAGVHRPDRGRRHRHGRPLHATTTGDRASTYSEDLNDNNEFYAREIEPYLGTGKPTNWDIVCPTNWMAARMKTLGWIEPLPLDLIPNRVNLDDRVPQPARGTSAPTHSLPWQAGITGIAYNPELTGRELRSINDLFDPEFKGRVAMLTEMRDSVGLTMLGMGADPTRARRGRERWRRSRRSRRPTPTASSGRSPATSTCAASRAATSSPAWPGRATSCSCSTTGPTSSSSSRRRAA